MRDAARRLTLALTILVACGRDASPPPAPPERAAPAAPPIAIPAAPEDPVFAHATALRRANRHREAADEYARLAAELARRGDRRRHAVARIELAYRQLLLGEHEAATAALPELRELTAGDAGLASRVAHLGAITLHREGRLEEARVEAERALALAQRVRDPERLSQAYGVLGTVHSLSGRYQESLAVTERRVAHNREHAPGSTELATALNSLGIDYRHFGRLPEAEEVYQEALAIYRARDDANGVAMILYNLANVLSMTGDIDRALDLKLEALALAEQVGNTYGLGLLHNDLGEIYREAGNLAAARRHLEQGLEIHRRARQAYGEVTALEFLGRLELAEGDPAGARELLLEAVRLADESDFGKERAMARATLASASAAARDAGEALRWSAEALTHARRTGDPHVELEALQARALALEAARDPAASSAWLEGLDLLESWRGRLALGERRMGLGDPWLAVYEGAVRTLLAQGRAGAAFDVAERSRARFLLELMDRRAAPGGGSEEERLEQRLRERYAARQKSDGPRRRQIDLEIAALTSRIDRLHEHGRSSASPAAAARYPRPAPVAALQRGLLAPGRLLIAFFWGERDVYGWWVDAANVRAARLGSVGDLLPRVDFLRSALENPQSEADWRPAAASLYRLLLAPLAPGAERELLVVADGPLAYLPLESLVPTGSDRPLAATRVVRYGPSASILLALAEAPPPGPFGRAVLAIGNPAGARGTARVASPPLPHAEAEARRIARLFRWRGSDLLRGEQASLERWQALRPGRYRYLHFAAHAGVGGRGRGEPHIELAGGDLGLRAIRRLELDAELVTLSGCETALGERVRGEGVIGLPHAFLAAGARTVLVSLWRVDDRDTAELMHRFYRELAAGHAPAEALWRARLDWLGRGAGRAHPSRWAPFILVGGLAAAPD